MIFPAELTAAYQIHAGLSGGSPDFGNFPPGLVSPGLQSRTNQSARTVF